MPVHKEIVMSKVLVLYYSAYGHIEKLADAVAAGARETGAAVDIKRVPETAPEAVAKAAHFKLDQKSLVATIEDLVNYHAIIVGGPTRFGRMSSQLARRVRARARGDCRLPRPQVATRAGLSTHQGAVGLPRKPDGRPLCL